jgi:hypothetical protein
VEQTSLSATITPYPSYRSRTAVDALIDTVERKHKTTLAAKLSRNPWLPNLAGLQTVPKRESK